MIKNQRQENEHSKAEILDKITGVSDFGLILYNDDHNTFEHVINCLMKYCDHDAQSAEQCSYIVHYKGKCTVKSGSFDTLEPMCDALCSQGLSATVELI